MKYWEILSIFSDELTILVKIQNKVHKIYDSNNDTALYNFQIVDEDYEIYFKESKKTFFVDRGSLRQYKGMLSKDGVLTAHEAFIRYGGSAIEETLEKGSCRVPVNPRLLKKEWKFIKIEFVNILT